MFKIGDVVCLKGDPRIRMTVTGFNCIEKIECSYFSRALELKSAVVGQEALVLESRVSEIKAVVNEIFRRTCAKNKCCRGKHRPLD